MRRTSFVLALLVLLGVHSESAQRRRVPLSELAELQTPDERIDRLERWLRAVEHHEIGAADADANEIGAFTLAAVQGLWIDVANVSALMRNPGGNNFVVSSPGRNTTRILYTRAQLARLRALAAVARRHGDVLFFRRAALLHSDIAILVDPIHKDPGPSLPVGPSRVGSGSVMASMAISR